MTEKNLYKEEVKCKLYYKGNNPKPRHKPTIEKADMKKLGEYFSSYHQNPVVLSEAVWFLLCFHFGRRGREGHEPMLGIRGARLHRRFCGAINAHVHQHLTLQILR